MTINTGAVCAAVAMACDDWTLGYSQPDRLNIQNGGNCDCSSLAAWAYNQGGASFAPNTSTHNMRARAVAQGFSAIPWHPGSTLIPGDALLSEAASGGVGHVAIYTGGDALREAWISETGDIDGAPGDQTGGETRTVACSAHPYTTGGTWTHILRPGSSTHTNQNGDNDMNVEQATQLANVNYLLHNSIAPALARLDQARVSEAAQLAALRAAVEALAKSQGVDPQTVTDTVDKAVRDALAGLEITLATKEGTTK